MFKMSLLSLPHELQKRVFCHLHARDLGRLAITNKILYQIILQDRDRLKEILIQIVPKKMPISADDNVDMFKARLESFVSVRRTLCHSLPISVQPYDSPQILIEKSKNHKQKLIVSFTGEYFLYIFSKRLWDTRNSSDSETPDMQSAAYLYCTDNAEPLLIINKYVISSQFWPDQKRLSVSYFENTMQNIVYEMSTQNIWAEYCRAHVSLTTFHSAWSRDGRLCAATDYFDENGIDVKKLIIFDMCSTTISTIDLTGCRHLRLCVGAYASSQICWHPLGKFVACHNDLCGNYETSLFLIEKQSIQKSWIFPGSPLSFSENGDFFISTSGIFSIDDGSMLVCLCDERTHDRKMLRYPATRGDYRPTAAPCWRKIKGRYIDKHHQYNKDRKVWSTGNYITFHASCFGPIYSDMNNHQQVIMDYKTLIEFPCFDVSTDLCNIRMVGFSPDGQYLAFNRSKSQFIEIIDIPWGNLRHKLDAKSDVDTFEWSDDGSFLISVSQVSHDNPVPIVFSFSFCNMDVPIV